jgi:cytochrome P450
MLNPFSPEVRQNPYPVYAELRRRGIYQLPESNMFLVSRYEDVREVMLNPEIFSVKEVGEAMMRHTPEILAVLAQGWPEVHTFTAESEQHAQYHALLSETFSVQGVEKLRPRIQHIVNGLIDTFIDDGRVEFVSKFVEPLVLRVLGEIVGIPEEEMPPVKRWCDDRRERMGGGISHQRELELARSHVAFQRYLLSKIEERRAAPRDDVITELVNSRLVKQEGRSLNTEELISMIWMLLIAGSGASPYFLGNAMLLLVQHPDQMALLRSDPSLFPNFVEESLRMETPFQYLFRTAKVDTELGGVKVPAGARVVTMYGAANRDEDHFTDPDRFDVRRPNAKTHLAFGEGIHYCLGSPLSRLEGTIAFASLLRRLDTILLSAGGYRLAAHPLIRGPKELHLAFGN